MEAELDSPLLPLGERGEGFIQTYQTQHGVLQFHLLVPGIRNFDDAEESSTLKSNENGVPVRTLSIRDFLVAKEATNRPQDIQDINFLRELLKRP